MKTGRHRKHNRQCFLTLFVWREGRAGITYSPPWVTRDLQLLAGTRRRDQPDNNGARESSKPLFTVGCLYESEIARTRGVFTYSASLLFSQLFSRHLSLVVQVVGIDAYRNRHVSHGIEACN